MEQHVNENFIKNLPERIRVSVGSAIILGLLEGKLDAEPTTTYLMTHKTGKCTAKTNRRNHSPSITDDPSDGSIVSTKAFCLATTKVQPQSCQT